MICSLIYKIEFSISFDLFQIDDVTFNINLSSIISDEKKCFKILIIFSSDNVFLFLFHNLNKEEISSISSSFSKSDESQIEIVSFQNCIKSLYTGKYLLVIPINESEASSNLSFSLK